MPEELEAYVDGSASEDLVEKIENHVSQCGDCGAELVRMLRESSGAE
jgi:hypothetical protein